ncbi:MAG: acetyl-CoA C-acyltransferase [Clostridiales Family XIII bacterium]|jgi:acetyl-CoA acyltransferase|nr:acetyl-CoA C-acyltransferase [Clostridiales Family XIII bacterium]
MKEVVIVEGLRSAIGKAPRGTLKNTRSEDILAEVMSQVLDRVPKLDPNDIDDITMGCAWPEEEQGANVARNAQFRAGIPYTASAQTVNRFCSSGLQAIAIAAQNIMVGWSDVALAGGLESNSMVTAGGYKNCPNPWLAEHYPQAFTSMAITAENVAARYHVSREDQDAFAFASHQKAIKAINEGKFKNEIVPIKVGGNIFDTDEGPRPDTSLEGLSRLRPLFKMDGTVTAGNCSQTSDGAAAVLLMSADKAKEIGAKPKLALRSYAVGGVPPEVMGIGPIAAIPKALKIAGLTLDQIELVELNEAFASQSLAVAREVGLDAERVNVNGGAIALGHPLGCTGAKLTVQIMHEMERRGSRYGMVTMCIGGGMGAAGIFERLN